DLYRLTEAEELEDLGLREVDWARDWTLVEWYERGAGFLPPPDLRFAFRYLGCGREVLVAGGSGRGQELAAELWPRLDRMVF
ncbi:MAG: tRNA (adenosine(37)-N6)-threonylcarbamoyltransferase complex ATPase subunit type 1 TsaE, partial [Salinisphaera sp.]|nr:tRNA (adenosine(37)-N6)-threonylcarbamoyltransferase complex ATPase subunit type 1 TsaE [Salinisphaera sp.]